MNPARKLVGLLAILAIFAGGLLFALWQLREQNTTLRRQDRQACVDRRRQYDALRAVIVKQNAQQPASAVILRAFPQFAPFYDPGTPEYAEAKRLADLRRDEALSVLGSRPDC